ncbi:MULTISPECIES: hypothetical protein [unclassified Hydrogenophaga]|nr:MULTISPECIES: hypothetical protein [unclassified Hydrogenophaga]MBN9369761.1 hypothetical protein [Hydrogenophaga sp.]
MLKEEHFGRDAEGKLVSNIRCTRVLGDINRSTCTQDWSSPNNRIEQMQLSDGQKLLAAQVDSLVNAMAAFAPPAPGQIALTPEQQTALSPVIAAGWN